MLVMTNQPCPSGDFCQDDTEVDNSVVLCYLDHKLQVSYSGLGRGVSQNEEEIALPGHGTGGKMHIDCSRCYFNCIEAAVQFGSLTEYFYHFKPQSHKMITAGHCN